MSSAYLLLSAAHLAEPGAGLLLCCPSSSSISILSTGTKRQMSQHFLFSAAFQALHPCRPPATFLCFLRSFLLLLGIPRGTVQPGGFSQFWDPRGSPGYVPLSHWEASWLPGAASQETAMLCLSLPTIGLPRTQIPIRIVFPVFPTLFPPKTQRDPTPSIFPSSRNFSSYAVKLLDLLSQHSPLGKQGWELLCWAAVEGKLRSS